MMQNKKFAITGGIGSGKSTVCQMLREKGFQVFSCDEIYRELRGERAYLDKIAELFPDCVDEKGLDAPALSACVFSDEVALERLNSVSHPLIMERLMARMNELPLSFAEVPLLFEGGFEPLFDGVLAIRREKGARVAAVRARDGLTEAEILGRMEKQFDDHLLSQKKCVILENNGDENALAANLKPALQTLFEDYPELQTVI